MLLTSCQGHIVRNISMSVQHVCLEKFLFAVDDRKLCLPPISKTIIKLHCAAFLTLKSVCCDVKYSNSHKPTLFQTPGTKKKNHISDSECEMTPPWKQFLIPLSGTVQRSHASGSVRVCTDMCSCWQKNFTPAPSVEFCSPCRRPLSGGCQIVVGSCEKNFV